MKFTIIYEDNKELKIETIWIKEFAEGKGYKGTPKILSELGKEIIKKKIVLVYIKQILINS